MEYAIRRQLRGDPSQPHGLDETDEQDDDDDDGCLESRWQILGVAWSWETSDRSTRSHLSIACIAIRLI